MEQYRYRALDTDNNPVSGNLEANDPQAVATQLQERGLLVLRVQRSSGAPGLSRPLWLHKAHLSREELSRFTQQLATLLGADQPLERALSILIRQPGKPAARQSIERIRDRVKAGQTLSVAMAIEQQPFTALYLSLVHAGETAGVLDETLGQLASYLERMQAIRAKVINALIYPTFLVVGVLGSLVLLLAYVVPQFVPIFNGLGVPVPMLTQFILDLGQFLATYGLHVLAMTFGLAWAVLTYTSRPKGRSKWHQYLLRSRLAGPLLKRLETARFARTLGTLLAQGVPLINALDISRQVANNLTMSDAVKNATVKVKNGHRLSNALDSEQLLPDLAIQMIEVGEESGKLDVMLLKVANIFDDEAQRSIDRLLAALIPSLTIVMAALVAVIMLAIMLPLMTLTSNI
ncbi:type II secretion system inner membrane protein GspF [Pseudomonas lactis]|uniref:Type II secretion system inner membrane protein GspF n=1 Tax=Pseudomonas lactis TaxID=1615674 RepID=A0A7Y1LB46_9PSED|nr:type II secretion system inner membrane protein GspF [Pseudomonas lactis]NNA42866.1 type II secretion system inner membrane protein GspF [Pseudomonas lactis]